MKEKYYWLNQDSRTFLSRDYLAKDQTPEERINDIKMIIHELSLDKTLADKFEDYLARGWYLLSTPIWTNFGNKRGAPISCLTGNSWLNTLHEGGTQIKDVKIGDKVLTHKGRYKNITNIQTRYSENDIYELKVQTRKTPIKITGNHPVLTNLGWVRVDELDPCIHYIATNHKLNITQSSLYQTIKFNNKKNYGSGKFEARKLDNIILKEDLAWAIGLWFAEGSLSRDKKKNANGIRITMGIPFKDTVEKFGEIIKKYTGLPYSIYESHVERNGKVDSWLNINFNSVVLGDYFETEFGKNCKIKNIPLYIKESPLNVLKAFFEGFYIGDGCKTHKTQSFTISNPKLAMSLYEIGIRCGYRMGLQMQQKSGKLSTTRYVYKVSIFCNQGKMSTSVNNGIEFSDGNRYCPFSLKKLNHNELVYDITVEDDHSFSVSGVIVHNCFNSHISDSVESFLIKQAEVGYMTKCGGGTSGYFGDVRGRGEKISTGGEAEGALGAMEMFYHVTNNISQGNTRRGHFAAYLPIEHPDIEEFLKIRDTGHAIQEMSIGVCVSDEFMNKMIAGDSDFRKIWAKVIKKRCETGYPYIFFTDNVNNYKPQVYKDLGYMINSSNMCAEIALPSTDTESFVCDLMSMNALHYDEWKHTDAIEVAIHVLDLVMTEFINKTKDQILMKAPRRFALNHRALGLGLVGWHSALQAKMLAFESLEANALNNEVWSTIRTQADAATEKLAKLYGEPSILKGYGRRNTTTLAIAPNTSSSFIHGQISPGIEPLNSNYFIKGLAKGDFTYINPYLIELLETKGKNSNEVLLSILSAGGSVQHLDFLSQEEKDVFKTFGEISQKAIIIQAAQRQKYIDQSQSLNIMISPETPMKEINQLMIFAWENKVKTLYYQRSTNPAQNLARSLMTCTTCES